MAKRLKDYKNEFGSRSILYYEQYGNGSLLKSIGEKFFNFYGGVSLVFLYGVKTLLIQQYILCK